MVLKNWVKNIQAAAYNGADKVDLTMYPLDQKIKWKNTCAPFLSGNNLQFYINNITLFKVV